MDGKHVDLVIVGCYSLKKGTCSEFKDDVQLTLDRRMRVKQLYKAVLRRLSILLYLPSPYLVAIIGVSIQEELFYLFVSFLCTVP